MYYRTASEYFRERFGCKVYKLAISGGMTCPNRDGTIGDRGCIFCLNGSGDFSQETGASVAAQLELAKQRVSFKAKNGKFIAYFQSFTNTYAPVDKLRTLFTEALVPDEIAALSVGTRPDCLPDDVISLLAKLNQKKPVMVELGLQTVYPRTADYIRRGYDLPVYEDAVSRLKRAGLEVIVHMIIGLPGETPDMAVETARYIARSGADGIKLQLLHILDGTDLADAWRAGQVSILRMEEYLEVLGRCVEALPQDMVIHRLTGDGAKCHLLAPMWSADKKAVLDAINRYFIQNDITQGRACDREQPYVF